ncbi:hypothetical protein BCR44DRAFT_1318148, partial [Catenaria anguillulae PL171]
MNAMQEIIWASRNNEAIGSLSPAAQAFYHIPGQDGNGSREYLLVFDTAEQAAAACATNIPFRFPGAAEGKFPVLVAKQLAVGPTEHAKSHQGVLTGIPTEASSRPLTIRAFMAATSALGIPHAQAPQMRRKGTAVADIPPAGLILPVARAPSPFATTASDVKFTMSNVTLLNRLADR